MWRSSYFPSAQWPDSSYQPVSLRAFTKTKHECWWKLQQLPLDGTILRKEMKKFVKYLVIFAKYYLQSLRNWSKSNKQAKVVWLRFIQISCAVKFEFNLELEMPSNHWNTQFWKVYAYVIWSAFCTLCSNFIEMATITDIGFEYLIHVYLYMHVNILIIIHTEIWIKREKGHDISCHSLQ